MAGDADDFHVAFLRLDALGRPQGDDRAVFVFHAVTDVAVRKQVEKMVLLGGERPEMTELRTGEGHVLRHEPRGVGGQGVVHPHVEIHALLAVAVVPKFGRSHPWGVHHVLHIACPHHGVPSSRVQGNAVAKAHPDASPSANVKSASRISKGKSGRLTSYMKQFTGLT